MSTAQTELAILCKLRDAGGNLVAEAQLWREVAAESTLPIARHSFTGIMRRMAEAGEVWAHEGKDVTKWKIMGQGEARLSEAGL